MMAPMQDLFQTGDWKAEKHVPVIDVPETVKKGEVFKVTLSIGKEIAHPNKTEHHIAWIALCFKPDGEKFPYEIGKTAFSAHGASTNGPDTSSVYTHHETIMSMKTDKPGTLFAASYCNIHGLWQNTRQIKVG